jgi:biopolymer transport protein ExbB/TolQ
VFKEEVNYMAILAIIYILLLIIVALVGYAILQIKLFGLNVKDFWSFIEANQMLDKLYTFSKKYEKLSTQEQVLYLMEAEKIFDAFDKVPEDLWEEEYYKYSEVLRKYKDIKMRRWASN